MYIGLIIKGTIPRVPPFSLWLPVPHLKKIRHHFFGLLVPFWEALPWDLFTGHVEWLGLLFKKNAGPREWQSCQKNTKTSCIPPKNTEHDFDFTLLKGNAVGQLSNSRVCWERSSYLPSTNIEVDSPGTLQDKLLDTLEDMLGSKSLSINIMVCYVTSRVSMGSAW